MAKKHNFSIERARQIIIRDTKILKQFSNLKYIIYGYNGVLIYDNYKKDLENTLNSELGLNLIKIKQVDGLSVRAVNCLNKAGIITLGDVKSRDQLLKIRNLGEKTANEITELLSKYGKQIN